MILSTLAQIFKENDCEARVHALSWEQIVELSADALCTIGAHTVSHASLPALSEDEIRKELLEGKKEIEDRIEKPVKHFSYPFGNMDDRVMGLVMEQFSTATTTKKGVVQKKDNLYALNRKILMQ
jgi:peptidoglycan/xylan/chitin deacetylase (PgdA/CDA1 family)